MNICLVINNEYVKYTKIFLISLFENNKDKSFNIYIIHSGLNENNINNLRELINKYNSRLYLLPIEESIFENAPDFWGTSSKETYYKLLIPEIIPDGIEKVLYLDVDIIINGEIDGIYNMDLKDKLLGVRPDYFVNRFETNYKESLGIKRNEIYFNAGVMLFNLYKFKKIYNKEEIFRYIDEHKEIIKFHDQEVFNALFHNDIVICQGKYNEFSRYKGIIDYIKYKLHLYTRKSIIHYAGRKPWNDRYFGKYYNLFWKYADMAKVKLPGEKYRNERKNIKNKVIVELKTIKSIIKDK